MSDPTIWDIIQTAVVPLLALVWAQLSAQLRDIKKTNDAQWKRIQELQIDKVSSSQCRDKHEPLERVLTNGLQEAIYALRERMAIIESQMKKEIRS